MNKNNLIAMAPIHLTKKEQKVLDVRNWRNIIKAGIVNDSNNDILELDVYSGNSSYSGNCKKRSLLARYFVSKDHSWFGVTSSQKSTKAKIIDYYTEYLEGSSELEKSYIGGMTLKDIQDEERTKRAAQREEKRKAAADKHLRLIKPLTKAQKNFLYKDCFSDQEFALVKEDDAYCTACETHYEARNLKNLKQTICPCCGKKIIVRKGKAAAQEITGVIPYTNEGRLIVEYYWVYRKFKEQQVFTSVIKQAVQVSDNEYYHNFVKGRNYKGDIIWKESDGFRFYGMGSNVHFPAKARIYRHFSLKGTKYQYLKPIRIIKDHIEENTYSWCALMDFCSIATDKMGRDGTVKKQYECYLKMGWKEVISSVLTYPYNGDCIEVDPTKKSIVAMLGLTKEQYNDLPKNPSPNLIKQLQSANKSNEVSNIKVEEIQSLIKIKGYVQDYLYLRALVTPHKIFRYVHTRDEMMLWKDYLQMQFKLGFKKGEIEFFPKDLKGAHDKAAALIEIENDRYHNEMLAKLSKGLSDKYQFESDDFVVVIPESVDAFKDEKAQMHNCVTNYIDRVCNKETVVLFVRRASAPEKSVCTMEIKDGKIVQLYGKRNTEAPKAVKNVIYGKFAKEKQLMVA